MTNVVFTREILKRLSDSGCGSWYVCQALYLDLVNKLHPSQTLDPCLSEITLYETSMSRDVYICTKASETIPMTCLNKSSNASYENSYSAVRSAIA